MKKIMKKILAPVACAVFLIASIFLPTAISIEPENPFFAFTNVSVEPKVFLVGYDPESLTDDYAYLSTIPSSLYLKSGVLHVSPLIFYQPRTDNIFLDAGKGADYYLEDWFSYAPDSKIVAISLGDELQDIKGRYPDAELVEIDGKTPPQIASLIATRTWKNSDTAVIAELPNPETRLSKDSGSVKGKIPAWDVGRLTFRGEKVPTLKSNYHNFIITGDYKWIEVDMEWGGYGGQDPDIQLYDWALGQVDASENWNAFEGPGEELSSYVYHTGKENMWSIGVTYMPTEGIMPMEGAGAYSPPLPDHSEEPSLLCRYTINVYAYPGKEVNLGEAPHNCRNANISLSGDRTFGLVVRDGNGAVVASQIPYTKPMELDNLGAGKYTATVISLDGQGGDFKVSYKWEGTKNNEFDEGLEDACNAAVFASYHNCPLLFAENGKINDETRDALGKLGVKKVYTTEGVKLGSEFKQVPIDFDEIREISGSTDIVFSSILPFNYVDQPITREAYGEPVNDLKVLEHSYFFGPAAYAAAFHGSELLIVENHFPQASAWHRHNWIRTRNGRDAPNVGDMVISGRKVYNELDTMGLDKEGKERILTVAGEFQLGPTWDRVLIGKAIPGRIFGTPVDASYWFARNAFYPAMIFANPALEGLHLINGSSSRIKRGNLVINGGGEEFYNYPVLNTWVTHEYKFNEIASDYWGLEYTSRTGNTPYYTKTDNPVDKGISRPGNYIGDMTTSETVPAYLERAGYSTCFSTNFRTTTENLNRGTLMWFEIMHGGQRDHGIVGFWSLYNQERNPWRAYDYLGSTENPDTLAMSKVTGLDINPGSDGVTICIWGQTPETTLATGIDLDRALDNIHSTGVVAGSCLIAHTYLHLSLIRHGSSFQVIDPWTTSWYCSHAFNILSRSIALGKDVGEAYEEAISEVGIAYLADGWWWDIFENIVYYGDPGLRVYSPAYAWPKPEPTLSGLHMI
jgi:hypothetical protein